MAISYACNTLDALLFAVVHHGTPAAAALEQPPSHGGWGRVTHTAHMHNLGSGARCRAPDPS